LEPAVDAKIVEVGSVLAAVFMGYTSGIKVALPTFLGHFSGTSIAPVKTHGKMDNVNL